jgi:hypothetical protein
MQNMRRSPYLLLLLLLVLSQCAPGFSFMSHHQGLSKYISGTTSIMRQSDPSKEETWSSSAEPSCNERRRLFSTAAASSVALLGGGFLLGASPAIAATDLSGMSSYGNLSGMSAYGGKKSKKIGGLATKIRGVCLNMVRQG